MNAAEDRVGADASGARRFAAVDPNFWATRRVLLTGHTGFKGSWLALWLQALGARVTGFSMNGGTRPSLHEVARVSQDMESIAGDVRDPEAIRAAVTTAGPEVVFHMAAQPLVRRSLIEPRETFQINVMGTVNMLDAIRQHGDGVRAIVNVTSDKCYENRDLERGYREEEPMGGSDPYSSSKGCAELVTAAFRRSFFSDPDGTRLASARAGNAIGGGDWSRDRLVPDIMHAALAGEEVRIRHPEAVRPVSWMVERIGELWPGGVGYLLEDDRHSPEARYLALDSSRARTRLGWRPLLGLEQALEGTVAWYRQLRDGANMRAATLAQIDTFQAASISPPA